MQLPEHRGNVPRDIQNLCTVGMACEHPEPVWRDENGKVVESKEEAFGCKSEFELIHPEHLIFVDEVGSNTFQTKDGQVGGQTYLCTADGRPQNRAATKDAHFTVLGFTVATGEPLLCAIIFAAKTLKQEWVTGFDPFAEWVWKKTLSKTVAMVDLILLAQAVLSEGKRFLVSAATLRVVALMGSSLL